MKTNTNQCKRKVCRNADKPSMRTKIPTVRTAQNAKIAHKITPPNHDSDFSPICKTMVHKTSDNSAKEVNASFNITRLHL